VSINRIAALILVLPVYILFYYKFSIQSVFYSYLSYILLIFIFLSLPKLDKNNKKIDLNLRYLFILIFIYFFSLTINFNNNIPLERYLVPPLYVMMFVPFLILIKRNTHEENIFFLKLINILLYPYIIYLLITFNTLNYSIELRYIPEGLHPNQIAEIVFIFLITSIFTKSYLIRLLGISLSFVLLILLQSRGIIISSLIFLFLIYNKDLYKKFIYLFLIFVFLFFFQDFLFNKIFLLNDEYRGLGTGFVGRTDGWIQGIDIFLENLFFGTGYNSNAFIHNGFIRMLSELGIFFSFIFFILIIRIVIKNLKYFNYESYNLKKFSLISILTYFFILFFAPRYINLNLMSVFFLYHVANLVSEEVK